MEKEQEYKIGAKANEFVNEYRSELSSIKKAELESMLKDFAIQQVKDYDLLHNVSQQRELLIGFKTWETDNDIKNLLPEQLVGWYIEEKANL